MSWLSVVIKDPVAQVRGSPLLWQNYQPRCLYCNNLATCPGCTLPLPQWQLGPATVLHNPNELSGYRKWTEGWLIGSMVPSFSDSSWCIVRVLAQNGCHASPMWVRIHIGCPCRWKVAKIKRNINVIHNYYFIISNISVHLEIYQILLFVILDISSNLEKLWVTAQDVTQWDFPYFFRSLSYTVCGLTCKADQVKLRSTNRYLCCRWACTSSMTGLWFH